MMKLSDLAFKMDELHTRLLNTAIAMEENNFQVPQPITETLEFLANAQVTLHVQDNHNHREKGQAINKVLLLDSLEVMTMLYQAVYDGKVLMQHDTKRIRDTIQEVEQTIQSLPKIIQLGYD